MIDIFKQYGAKLTGMYDDGNITLRQFFLIVLFIGVPFSLIFAFIQTLF